MGGQGPPPLMPWRRDLTPRGPGAAQKPSQLSAPGISGGSQDVGLLPWVFCPNATVKDPGSRSRARRALRRVPPHVILTHPQRGVVRCYPTLRVRKLGSERPSSFSRVRARNWHLGLKAGPPGPTAIHLAGPLQYPVVPRSACCGLRPQFVPGGWTTGPPTPAHPSPYPTAAPTPAPPQ